MKNSYPLIFLLILGSSCNINKKENNDNMLENESVNVTLADDHSYAIPQEAKMVHLDWNAEIDFQNKLIHATATIFIEKSINSKKIVLDSKGLTIQKVSLNDEDIGVDYNIGVDDPIKGAPITIAITDSTEKVVITYSTSKNAKALQWLDPQLTAEKRFPFLFTQSQAILARTWIPLQDSPGIRFTYTAKVKVPQNLLALMSASNPVEKSKSGIYNFKMEQAIPAYLLALAVGDLEFQEVGSRSGIYAEPSILGKAIYEFADLESMIGVAETLYGPYLWDRYDVLVLPSSFPFGGMENPRLTFATPTILSGDRSLIALIAHELAHSWSGNLVTNATWNDFWLNEGFTVYFEHRIMEELYGKDYSEMLASLSMQDLKEEIADMQSSGKGKDTWLKLDLSGRDPDEGVTSIAYDKGYFFLRQIEEMVGREKFDLFLNEYFRNNSFNVMSTEDFIAYITKYLFADHDPKVIDALFDTWIFGEGIPIQHPVPVSDRFKKVDEVLKRWKEGSDIQHLISQKDLADQKWSTHEWLYFIRNLGQDLSIEQMVQLDNFLDFTNSGNSEILTSWLVVAIQFEYTPAYDKLKQFLISTGRRKFLTPLYSQMLEKEKGKAMAKEIYKEARQNYHYVSRNTIDELLHWENGN